MSGYYLMHRGWLDHPVFSAEPFSRRDAWCWLIESAYFRPGEIPVKGKTVTLQRGQLCHSLRHMARAWQWDEARVRRFLSRLQTENMIRCVADAGQTLITICKYDDYQIRERVADAPTDAAATQERRSADAIEKEGKESKLVGSGGDARAVARNFVEARNRHWPNTSRQTAPSMTLEVQAGQHLAVGGTPELIAEVLERGMGANAARGLSPPSSFAAFADSLNDAIRRHLEAQRPITIQPGNSNGSSRRTVPPRGDYEANLRRNLQGVVDALADELGPSGIVAEPC